MDDPFPYGGPRCADSVSNWRSIIFGRASKELSIAIAHSNHYTSRGIWRQLSPFRFNYAGAKILRDYSLRVGRKKGATISSLIGIYSVYSSSQECNGVREEPDGQNLAQNKAHEGGRIYIYGKQKTVQTRPEENPQALFGARFCLF